MKRAKITPARLAVLRQLADGYEAATSRGFGSAVKARAWLQHGGIGKGGKSQDVRESVLLALSDAGLIKCTGGDFRVCLFNITDAGHEAVKAAK